MTQQTLNNGETGATIRSKINGNFAELYAMVAALTPAPSTNPTVSSGSFVDALTGGGDFTTRGYTGDAGVVSAPGNGAIDVAAIATEAHVYGGQGAGLTLARTVKIQLDDWAIGGIGFQLVSNGTDTKVNMTRHDEDYVAIYSSTENFAEHLVAVSHTGNLTIATSVPSSDTSKLRLTFTSALGSSSIDIPVPAVPVPLFGLEANASSTAKPSVYVGTIEVHNG